MLLQLYPQKYKRCSQEFLQTSSAACMQMALSDDCEACIFAYFTHRKANY
jgi:hypothetical protein